MIQHVIIAVIFFIVGTAWGCGIACMLAANARRKRLFAARVAKVKQRAEAACIQGVIRADSTGRLYLEKFDA